MVKLRLQELLNEKGKTIYWLGKKAGINPNQMAQIVRNEIKLINLNTLDKMSDVLECSIGDIFVKTNEE